MMFQIKASHERAISREFRRISKKVDKARKNKQIALFIPGDIMAENIQRLETNGYECTYVPLNKPGWEIILK